MDNAPKLRSTITPTQGCGRTACSNVRRYRLQSMFNLPRPGADLVGLAIAIRATWPK